MVDVKQLFCLFESSFCSGSIIFYTKKTRACKSLVFLLFPHMSSARLHLIHDNQ